MNFMVATINMADFTREVKVGYFNDDTKLDFYTRYRHKLTEGVEGAILERLLRMVRELNGSEGISLRVELAPFSAHQVTVRYVDMVSVRDLCDELAELSVEVLKKARRGDD